MNTILRSLLEDVHLVSFAGLGRSNGEGIRSLLRARAAKRIGLSRPTFAQLHEKTGVRLRVSATDLCTCSTVCFSPDKTPDTDVVDAVYGSMAVPPLFAPSRTNDSRLLVDGGLIRNVPRLPHGTPPERVLVLRAVEDGSNNPVVEPVNRVQDYISRIVRCAFLARVRDDLGWLEERGLAGQTISMDCNGISSAFSFGLNDRTKEPFAGWTGPRRPFSRPRGRSCPVPGPVQSAHKPINILMGGSCCCCCCFCGAGAKNQSWPRDCNRGPRWRCSSTAGAA